MIEFLELHACSVRIKGRHALKRGTCSNSNTEQQYSIYVYCTEAIHIKVKSSTINSIMVMDSKPQFYIMPLECYIIQSEFYNIPPTVL